MQMGSRLCEYFAESVFFSFGFPANECFSFQSFAYWSAGHVKETRRSALADIPCTQQRLPALLGVLA